MQIHNLTPIYKRKDKKKIGRGGKKGTTSGRGTKGQTSRSGSKKIRPAIYDLINKLPKLRGWKMKSIKEKPAIVNLNQLDKHFFSGATINLKSLYNAGLIDKKGGRWPKVKILGQGELNKKLNFESVSVSQGAKEKILKSGGEMKNLKINLSLDKKSAKNKPQPKIEVPVKAPKKSKPKLKVKI